MSLRLYPRAELGKQRGNNPGADTTTRRVKKMLPKRLRFAGFLRRSQLVWGLVFFAPIRARGVWRVILRGRKRPR